MDIESLALVLVGMQLTAVVLSAYNWNKRRWLRKAPIPTAGACGLIYILSGHGENASSWELVGVSFLIGVGFYFCVWVQCREKGEGFL